MKKKKFIPKSKQFDDFIIFDISATLPDYTFAFRFNKILGTRLERDADLKVYHSSPENPETFSFYFFEKERDRNIFLIHSLADQNLLMKSFFLIFQGYFGKEELEKTITAIENIEDVLNLNKIELLSDPLKKSPQLKKKITLVSSILTDLEYHMIEVNRNRIEQKVQLKKRPGNIKKLFERF